MNGDGSSPTQITTNGFFNGYPSLSPDGTKILVLSNMAGVIDSGIGTSILQMYTMNVDGTKPTRITKDDQRYLDPVWSPDGSKIAFASSVKDKDTYQGYHYELFTANADGSNKTKITTGEQRSGYVTDSINPSWSPDSSKLSFTSNKTRYYSIYTINADGSNQNKISLKETTNYEEQSWSPDGTKIVFSRISGETVKNNEIFSINIDGSNETQLTDDKSEDKYPSWSPDSSKIVFTSNREKILNTENKGFQVYVMNSDGTNQTRITATNKEHINPRWAK